MKIAVIGATGQLGSDLVKVFDEVIPLTHVEIEIKDLLSCLKTLEKYRPDVVINCASCVRVDDAEDYAEEVFAVNSVGAKNVAIACKKINAVNVYISTDYVFDGSKNIPYTEEDRPNPINTYGISKLAGEFYTKLVERHYIIRVSSLFGAAGASGKGGNFVETMITKAKNNEKIMVVDDMVMSPTYTRDAAEMIKEILIKKMPFGTYHAANKGQCSWYQFAKTIFNTLGIEVSLAPTKANILQSKARRPMYSPLVSVNLKKYGLEMESWEAALKNYLIEKGYLR